MVFTLWRKWFRRQANHADKPAARTRHARPALEALEDRTLPAVQLLVPADAFDASSRTLLVTGDEAGPANDTIIVRQADGQAGTLQVAVNGRVEYSGPTSAFGSLAIDAGAGHDTITFADGLSLSGGVLAQASAVDVQGTVRAGGVRLFGTDSVTVESGAAVVSPGGAILLQSSAAGTTVVSGTVDASDAAPGQVGGTVEVLGGKVGLFSGGRVDVSGDAGGGAVLVGGNFHGAGPEPNAQQTYVNQTATIAADALTSGDGGRVAVWADGLTRFYGQILAAGGPQGGDGGIVEVSGKDGLGYDGHVDTGASQGHAGSLLLDPKNIIIATGGSGSATGSDSFTTDPTLTYTLDPGALSGAAANTTVNLQANTDITFQSPLSFANGSTSLNAQAGRSILVNANITTKAGFIILEGNKIGAVAADRDPGQAVVSMAPGITINTTSGGGSGSIDLVLDPGGATGDITIGTLNAGGNFVFINNSGPTAGSSIRMASLSDQISASQAQFYVNGNSTGTIGTAALPLNLSVATVAATGQAGGVFLNSNSSLTIGPTNEQGFLLNGITTAGGGPVSVVSPATASPLSVTSAITVTGGPGSITLEGGAQVPPVNGTSPVNIQAALSTPGGTVTLNGISGVVLNGSASVSTGGGNYIVNSDDDNGGYGPYEQDAGSSVSTSGGQVQIRVGNNVPGFPGGAAVTLLGTINAGSGNITIAPDGTSAIGIGTSATTDAGGFALDGTALGNLTSSGTVTVGFAGNTGAVNITTVNVSAKAYNLTVQGGPISVGGVTLASGKTLQLISSGAITNNNGAAANVTIGGSGAVLFSATGGVGTSAALMNTAVSVLAATAGSAGLFINQTGALTVGAVGTAAGITVTGSGGVTLNTTGALTLAQAIADTGGTTTLNVTSGGVNQTAGGITAANLLLTGGAGTYTLTGTNSVSTLAANVSGALSFTDGVALAVGTVGTTNGVTTNNNAISLTVTAGGLTVNNTPAAIDLNAGVSTVQLAVQGAGQLFTLAALANLTGTGGVTITADAMSISGPIAAGTARAVFTEATAGRLIDLGLGTAANSLGLSTPELSFVTAGTIKVGDSAAGNLTVSASLNPAGATTLSLETGGSIVESAGASISVTSLALRSANAINFGPNNAVSNLAGAVTGSGNAFTFTSAGALTVTTVDGVNGVSTNNGAVTITSATGGLTVNNTGGASDVNAGNSTLTLKALGANQLLTLAALSNVAGTGGVTLVADDMTLNGTVNAGTATALLTEVTAGRLINLGLMGTAVNTLGLSETELSNLNAGLVKIGDANSGAVSVSGAVAPTGTTALSLTSGGAISSQGAGDTITIGSLALRAAGAVTLTQANSVGTLAASVSVPSAPLQFTDSTALTVGGVDGATGVATINSAITLITTGNGLTVNHTASGADVSAGTSTVSLQVKALNQMLTVAGGAGVTGNAGVTLIADQMNLAGTVSASGGTVTIQEWTAGQQINLGAASASGTLGLAALQVGNLTAAEVKVGDASAGSLTVSAAVNFTGTPLLSLQTGGSLQQGAAAAITVSSLALQAGDISMAAANAVTTLAASATTAGATFQFTAANGLTVGALDGVNGVSTNNGAITLTTVTGLLRVIDTPAAADVNAGTSTVTLQAQGAGQTLDILASANVSGTSGVTLLADNIVLDGTVTATGATAVLAPVTAGRAVKLGTPNTALALGVTNTELSHITAAVIEVGNATSGSITVSGPVSLASGTLSLLTGTGGTITQLAAATLSASLLALRAGGAITLTLSNHAPTLAATTTAGDIQFTADGSGMALGTADGLNGITDTAGTVTLSTTGSITNGLAAGVDVTATRLVLIAGGVGTSGTPLQTTITNLEASIGSGSMFLANSAALTIGGGGPTVGVTATGGTVQVSCVGALTVNENVTNAGGVTLTAIERTPPGAGDNLTVNAGVTVKSTAGAVTLQAGDLISIPVGATAQAAGVLTLTTGFNDNDGIGGITASGALSGSSIALQGGPGNETFTLNGSTTGPLTVNGGEGSDTYLITFGAFGSPVSINDTGTTGTDTVTVSGTANADTLAVSATAVTWNGTETVNYAGVEALTVDGGNGDDVLQVTSTAAGTPVTLDGQGGNDTYQVTTGALAAPVTVSDSGTSGTDTLTVLGTAAADTLAVTATAVTWGGTQTVNYSGVEALTVDGAGGDDTLQVTSTLATTPVTLDGQAGSDTYQITVGALASAVTVSDSGAAGTDSVVVTGTAAANTFVVTSAAVTWNGTETVNYAGVEALAVDGGAANDSFQVNSTPAGTAVTLDGEGGSDSYQVTLGSIAGPVTVSDSGTSGTDTLTLTGTPAPNAFAVSATTVTWNGAQTVNYSGIETLALDGGAANDSFVVTGTPAGLALTLDGMGGSDTYQVTVGNLASPVTVSDSGTSGTDTLTVIGTANADTLAVTAAAVTWNGTQTVNYTGVESLTVDGADGNDTLQVSSTSATTPVTLDGQGGDDAYQIAVGALASPVTVSDSGPGGNDSLLVTGTAAADAFAVTSTAVTWNGTQTVNYTGVESLTVDGGDGNDSFQVSSTVAGTPVTLDGQGGSDTYQVAFGGLGAPVAVSDTGTSGTDVLLVTGTAGADGFGVTASAIVWDGSQTVNYAGIDALTVDGGDGDDSFQLSSTAAGTPVTLDGQGGSDSYLVAFGGLAAPVTVSDSGTSGTDVLVVTGTAGGDTLAVTSTAVTWDGSQTVGYAGIDALTVDGGDGNDALQVSSTAATTPVTLDGQGGDDVYQVAFGALASAVTVSDSAPGGNDTLFAIGTAAADTLAVTATAVTWDGAETINYAGIAGLTVQGGDGDDTLSVASSSAAVTLDGQGGNDTYQVAFGALAGPVNVSDSGTSGADALTVTGTPGNDALLVTAAGVVWNGAETVNYQGVESLTVNAGDGNDAIQVSSTAAGTATTVNGEGGDDSFSVANPGGGLITGLAGPLTLDGGAGRNSLTVSEAGATAADGVVVTNNAISGSAAGFVVRYQATGGNFAGGVTYQGGNGPTLVNVQSTLAGGPTTVRTGAAADAIIVSSSGSASAGVLTGLAGPLTIDAGGGANTLIVSEAASTHADSVTVSASSISGAAVPFAITYRATGGTFGGGVSVATGSGNDTVYVLGTPAGSPTNILTGAGDDTILVSSSTNLAAGQLSGLGGPLGVDAGGGSNLLAVSEAGSTTPDRVFLVPGAIVGTAPSFAVFYRATGGSFARGVTFVAGAGDDSLIVQGKLAGSPLTVYGGGGNDFFYVGVTTASAYSGLLLDGGLGTNTAFVVDQSGGAVVRRTPSGPGMGTFLVSYLVGSTSTIAYQNMTNAGANVDPASSYIQALYHAEIGINAGPADVFFWEGVLYSGGPLAVAEGIRSSLQARFHLVALWYLQFFGFMPTLDAEQPWVDLLAAQNEESVLSAFLGSGAYFAQANFDNGTFLQNLYNSLLGRAPTASEVQLYQNTLMATVGRPGTALLVLTSVEYRTLAVKGIFMTLFGFVPDDATVNAWVFTNLSLGDADVFIESGILFPLLLA